MRRLWRSAAWLLLGAGVARGQVMADGWTQRRALTFKPVATDAPGEAIAVAEFYANGAQKADASDLRITSGDRMLVPMRMLESSPENDFIRVAFALNRGDGPYYAWWGNAKPEQAAPPLEIQRGLLAEVYRFPGGSIENESRLTAAAARLKAPAGAVFVPTIFLGFNPLGADFPALTRFTGQFKLDKPGAYDVAMAVQNAGLVSIDGKSILFQRGMLRDARNAKKVDLTQGWHKLEVIQVDNRNAPGLISLAWRPAGNGAFTTLPANLFAPVSVAEPGPLETVKQSFTADFSIDAAAEAFVPPDDYMPRYNFAARIPETFRPAPALLWNFGDGQSSTLARVHHYFLSPGNYTVTLTLRQGGNTFTTAQRISVRDRIYGRFPTPPEDPLKTVAPVLGTYNLNKLTAEQRLRGLLFFKRHNDIDNIMRWGRSWLEAKSPQSDETLWNETFDLARLYESRDMPKEAAEAFRLCSEKPGSAAVRTDAMRWQTMVLCDQLDDGGRAFQIAEAWSKGAAPKTDAVRRAARAAMVYAAIARGDGKLATALANEGSDAESGKRAPIDQGVLARNIESAIAAQEFDQAARLIADWERDFLPAAIDGFTRLLRVKLLAAEGHSMAAARVAMQHAKALPNSFYAAELLYRASAAYQRAHQPEEAKGALQLLKEKYPESPYARQEAPGAAE